jgi:hypothetical protein
MKIIVALLACLAFTFSALAQTGPWWTSVTSQSGTSYSITAADCGTAILFTNSSPITTTLPATINQGCPIRLVQLGAGVVTIQAGAGASLVNPGGSTSTVIQGVGISAVVMSNSSGTNAAWLVQATGLIVPTQSPGENSTLAASDAFVGAAVIAGTYTLPASTLTVLGGIKSNITLIGRTTSPVSVTMGSISVVGISVLPSVSVTVPGVSAGDFVLASFSGTPPTSVTIGGVQATAANTVQITPIATAALVAGSQSVPLNFVWMH